MSGQYTNDITPVTVAVDAMGGDKAPQAVVEGAIAAARALPDISIILVGDESVIKPMLLAQGDIPANISCQHASQVIGMCEAPADGIRQKRDASISVGMRLVRDGKAQAIISAGNSGAMMAGGMLILKAQKGIDRPAIATLMPTQKGKCILLDAGATTDCKPYNLVQFAHLGNDYARAVLQEDSPRIGLVSIGEEASKGDELTKEAHLLLAADSELNFIGNVEPKEMFRGEVDVLVCDGFVGNLILKTGEGISEFLLRLLKREFTRSWITKIAALILKPAFARAMKVVDYAEVGGALLLGVNGVVIIGHGRSNSVAIENAIRLGAEAAVKYAVLAKNTKIVA